MKYINTIHFLYIPFDNLLILLSNIIYILFISAFASNFIAVVFKAGVTSSGATSMTFFQLSNPNL